MPHAIQQFEEQGKVRSYKISILIHHVGHDIANNNLPSSSQGICKADPYVQKFDIPLLSKTLVSKIDLKHDPLSMDLE